MTTTTSSPRAQGAPPTPQSILLVDDDPAQIQILGRILAGLGDLRFAISAEAALSVARESPPDLVLLDAEMPGMSGFKVCELLKADPVLADIPVIFITSHSEPAFEVAGFKIGAADFIAKPVNPALVLARVQTQLRLKGMADELRRIATMDCLTGIANRRCFEDALAVEWRRAYRTGSALSLLMIDVDHFKLFNDRYGHLAGDVCLHAIAKAVASACLRPADLVARFGGEEFVVLLPHTPRVGAEHIAQGVLAAIKRLGVVHEASPTSWHVTVSVGVASYEDDRVGRSNELSVLRNGTDPTERWEADDLLRAADQALYAAKNGGRAQARLVNLAEADPPGGPHHIAAPSRDPQVHASEGPRAS